MQPSILFERDERKERALGMRPKMRSSSTRIRNHVLMGKMHIDMTVFAPSTTRHILNKGWAVWQIVQREMKGEECHFSFENNASSSSKFLRSACTDSWMCERDNSCGD
jgi:hypothetical protein